jgi:hypothetical protein
MFDQVKEDPAKLEEAREEEETIVVSDYITYNKDQVLTSDAFYCTRFGQVRGTLSLMDKYLQFDPIECPDNESLVSHS